MARGANIGIFKNCERLGEGTYAVVYQSIHPVTKEKIALKYMKNSRPEEGSDLSTLRELKYLKCLKHVNIINLIDVFTIDMSIVMVLDMMSGDLEELIKDKKIILSIAHTKSIMLMALRGVAYCHMNHILHRDIKPANFLISFLGIVKLADFGLARDYGFDNSMVRPLTSNVITSWYRPPELFLDSRFYEGACDIWSMGCIMGELLRRLPLFQGSKDIEVFNQIISILGSPKLEDWPNYNSLPKALELKDSNGVDLRALFPGSPQECVDLIRGMLKYNPKVRLTAKECLLHSFFVITPHPTLPENLPKISRST
eukprot:NODE_152_length_16986_cov_0.478119.p8 type:complete len:313 gc:universal NODE_152_length_16986_cov_0.478119:618-1556(+)